MLKKEIEFWGYELTDLGKVKPSAILRRMQEIAGEDVYQYGLGYDFMLSLGVVFVLSKIRFELKRSFRDREKLFLTTHSRRIHGVTFVRDFVVETEDGEEILTCESLWALLNFKERTLARPTVLPLEGMVYTAPERHPENARLFPPQGEAASRDRRVVYPSLLDQNRHLNNCNYADLVLDALPRGDAEVRDLQIDFKKEALCDQVLLVERFSDEEGHTVVGRFEDSGEVCFLARAYTFGEKKHV